MNAVQVVGRAPVTVSDKLAHGAVKLFRSVHLFSSKFIQLMNRAAFDFVSGYKPYHVPASILAESPLPIERLRKEGKILSDRQWLLRIIVLESVAGVPGMVGGTLRHLRSLRLLVRPHVAHRLS